MSLIWVVVISTFFSSMVMAGVWAWARKIDNYSIVDIAWSYLFFLVALLGAVLETGWWPRSLLILTCVAAWSGRLGTFLALRISKHHPHEDGRYVELRKSYSGHVARGFFWFYQYQGWSVVLLSIPFFLICRNAAGGFKGTEVAGAVLWALSLLGESTADRQMKAFKANPKNAGRTCDVGLWRYSRHPNYFFESLIWFSYFFMALASPGGWTTIYCPLLILFLLLKVTGVPMAEAQSLKSRGEEYAAYKRRTSVFVPWFPKKSV